MFNHLRLFFRIPAALFWTLIVHGFCIRVRQWFAPRRYLGPIGFWGAGLAWIMGIKIHKINEPDEPMADLIVANHMGFLDVPVLLSIFPAVFIIKMEMRRVFFFGKALEREGHVFVDRDNSKSRRQAGIGVLNVLKENDRIIVFPEGKASPGAERAPFKPFSFTAAKRFDKTVQACIIDYLPDRSALKWDIKQKAFPQLVALFGRKRTHISIEFLPSEKIDDPGEIAQRYQDIIQGKLEENDRRREAGDPIVRV